MYTIETRELYYDYIEKKHLFSIVERKFGSPGETMMFVKQFRERAEPGERASAYKRIDDTDYRMPC